MAAKVTFDNKCALLPNGSNNQISSEQTQHLFLSRLQLLGRGLLHNASPLHLWFLTGIASPPGVLFLKPMPTTTENHPVAITDTTPWCYQLSDFIVLQPFFVVMACDGKYQYPMPLTNRLCSIWICLLVSDQVLLPSHLCNKRSLNGGAHYVWIDTVCVRQMIFSVMLS